MSRVAVVGSRGITNRAYVYQVLDSYLKQYPNMVVVSGGARGVDTLAVEWAKDRGVEYKVWPADWNKYGRSAGYKRNLQIWDDSDLGVAFWDGKSKGTAHSFKLAKESGKHLEVFNLGGID